MGTTFYGKEGSFKPIDAQVNVALNRDAQAAAKELEGLKLLRQGYDERDSEFINALRQKWVAEKDSKDLDKRRVDKNFVDKQNAIRRNKDQKRRNLDTELANIRREADNLAAFTKTGSKVLNNLADRQERKIESADLKDTLDRVGDYTDLESDVQKQALLKSFLQNDELSWAAYLKGESPEVITYLDTLPPALKIDATAKVVADLNNDPTMIRSFFENQLNSLGTLSHDEKIRLLEDVLPEMLLKQTGLALNNTSLINDFRKGIKKQQIALVKEIKNDKLNKLGEKNIAEAYQYWRSEKGKITEQGSFDILQSKIFKSHKDGVIRGNAGVKTYIRGMLVDPQVVADSAEFERILDMKTLPNLDSKGNITQAARPFRQVFSASELYDIKKERLEAEKNALETEELKAEIHSKEIKQEVRRALLEDWDASEEMKEKIFATAPGLSDKDRKDLESLTVQIGNNTDLVEQRLAADKKIRDGVFFEDDYLMLSPSLRAMDKYRKGYTQISQFVAKTGWDKSTVTQNMRDLIQNDILKVKYDAAVVTPTNNRTVSLAQAEAKKDFFKYVSAFMDDPEYANKSNEQIRDAAYSKLVEEITSGKGKWRVDDEYKGAAGKNIGDSHFPYFDGANTSQHKIKYPLAHTLDLIDEHGSTLLKTDLVLTPAYIMAQEAQLEMGRGFQVTQDVKEIAEKSGLTESEVINQQRELLGLKGDVEPSVREDVVKSAAQIEQNNAAITKLSKNIRSLDDALKARVAQQVPRLTTAMTSTSRWQLAVKGAGIPIGTYKTVEQLNTFSAGQQLLAKYFNQTGGFRGGAAVVSRRRVKDGTRLVIQLPGSDPNEPRHIYLFKGDM
tara:strand:+ start:993 stop:3527 length:2535 start_codon:yes stop_codon:yes gene_type:complete